jgi:hypothetical protein
MVIKSEEWQGWPSNQRPDEGQRPGRWYLPDGEVSWNALPHERMGPMLVVVVLALAANLLGPGSVQHRVGGKMAPN